jgi:hypothetical protein
VIRLPLSRPCSAWCAFSAAIDCLDRTLGGFKNRSEIIKDGQVYKNTL